MPKYIPNIAYQRKVSATSKEDETERVTIHRPVEVT
jgi:hypothetical protein